MQPEVSLPNSPVTILNKSSTVNASPSLFFKTHFNTIHPVRPPSGSFPQVSPPKTLLAPHISHKRSKCSAHLVLLDLVIRIIFGEEYRL